MTVRIAMWSGPRNISTAMMRAWEARGDCAVSDEPLYVHYLKSTGFDHPGRDEILAAEDPGWTSVVGRLTGPVPGGAPIWYQKHMAHHLTPDMDTAWLGAMRHALLIREPGPMLTSLAKVLPTFGVEETGLPQQVRLLEMIERETGAAPPVVESKDVLLDPPGVLEALCSALDVPFTDRMLSWAPGPRNTDGVWAKHWYASVEASTGFAPYEPKPVDVPENLHAVLHECGALYGVLAEHRIGA